MASIFEKKRKKRERKEGKKCWGAKQNNKLKRKKKVIIFLTLKILNQNVKCKNENEKFEKIEKKIWVINWFSIISIFNLI